MVIDLRPVLHLVGGLLCLVGAAMALPAVVDLLRHAPEAWVFVVSGGVTMFFGMLLLFGMRGARGRWTTRQIILAVVLGWSVPPLFAALPFAFGPLGLGAVDAWFEAVSMLTASGASVIEGLDRAPHGLLLWRALLNGLGGLGTLAMALAILPVLAVGGMQVFRLDLPGPADRSGVRVGRLAALVAGVYGGAIGLLALALWQAGMTGFEAVVHALGAVATGGASTSDASAAHFVQPEIHVLLTVGMVVGGLPFLLALALLRRERRAAFADGQVRWYAGLLGLGTLGVSAWLLASHGFDPVDALRHGTFTTVSVMTGSGYATLPPAAWGGMPAAILFFLAFVGGCAGSTTGGLKVFRVQVLFADAVRQLRRLVRPHAVEVVPISRHALTGTVPGTVSGAVMGFVFVYALAFAGLAVALSLLGLGFLPSIGAAAAALANLGPALGPEMGAAGAYAHLPDAAKLLLGLGMLLGRVELVPVLVLMSPAFWRP